MNTPSNSSCSMLNRPFIRIGSLCQNRKLCSVQTHLKRRLRSRKFGCAVPLIHSHEFFISELYISYYEIPVKMNTPSNSSCSILNRTFIRISSFYQNCELCYAQTQPKRSLLRWSSVVLNRLFIHASSLFQNYMFLSTKFHSK